MSIVFRKLDQSIFILNKKGQATCLACLGMEKTGTSTTTFLFSFLYMRSSKCKMKKLLLITHSHLCVTCMCMHMRKKNMFPSSCLFKNTSLVNTISKQGGKM